MQTKKEQFLHQDYIFLNRYNPYAHRMHFLGKTSVFRGTQPGDEKIHKYSLVYYFLFHLIKSQGSKPKKM